MKSNIFFYFDTETISDNTVLYPRISLLLAGVYCLFIYLPDIILILHCFLFSRISFFI